MVWCSSDDSKHAKSAAVPTEGELARTTGNGIGVEIVGCWLAGSALAGRSMGLQRVGGMAERSIVVR